MGWTQCVRFGSYLFRLDGLRPYLVSLLMRGKSVTITLKRYVWGVVLTLSMLFVLIGGTVTHTGKTTAGVPQTVLGQEADTAGAYGSLGVSCSAGTGVNFRYYGNPVWYYLGPCGYRPNVQAWAPARQGLVAYWNCGSGYLRKNTGVSYPTCSVFVHKVTAIH